MANYLLVFVLIHLMIGLTTNHAVCRNRICKIYDTDRIVKLLSKQFFASVEVSNMARYSSKTNELRDIDSIGCRARNIAIKK